MASDERVSPYLQGLQGPVPEHPKFLLVAPDLPGQTRVDRAMKTEAPKMPDGLSPEERGQWKASQDAATKSAQEAEVERFLKAEIEKRTPPAQKASAPVEKKEAPAQVVSPRQVVPCEAFKKAAVTILESHYVKMYAERGAAKKTLESFLSLSPDVIKTATVDVDRMKLPAQLVYESRLAVVEKQLPGLAMAIAEIKSMDCSSVTLAAAKKAGDDMKKIGVKLSEADA